MSWAGLSGIILGLILWSIFRKDDDFSLDEIIERFQQWFGAEENFWPLTILGFMLFMFILGIFVFMG